MLRWSVDAFVYATDFIELEPPSCGNPSQVERANVDGDEFDDVLVFTDCIPHPRFGEQAGFYLFRGSPVLVDLHPEFVQTDIPVYRALVEDFDGDGLDDVLFDNIEELDLFVAEGDGKFGPAIVVWTSDIPLSLDSNNVWEFDFADLDGDGAKEILAGRTVILDPLGSPVFEDYIPEGVFAPVIEILPAGDISGDGVDDLVLLTSPVTVAQVLISGPPGPH
ncbi:MAG: VCBS repeat-containing protein [Deltaproteobacteria bacterium]|nr:VCBS repeat-containing protein [Deltaproteobacteria bacterium]MBK8715996.1 VCBS repeat-containing protein [Deltaproteobacteria bacterium]MBP7289911.1 VCBS repeat-containing protein [Nannocystaceae bacterium]